MFLVFNLQIVEVEYNYDSICESKLNDRCIVNFDIESDMRQPIFVYYQLENFYRPNRNFYKSHSVEQLRGDVKADVGTCEPYKTNKQMEKLHPYNRPDVNLDPEAVAFPCGEIAYTYFDDSFELFNLDGVRITIDETKIAWESDRDYNFKNPDNW